jgi:transposase
MRFYTTQHPLYCGIDLHARSMDVWIVNDAGEILVHRTMKAAPEPFLKAVAPYRDGLGVAVEGLCTWYWLAALCAHEGVPFVWGHALSMQAIHGGTATNDTSDAQKIAALLRGGMLPQAYVAPAEMRAPRDLLRRRTPLRRKRAELFAPVQKTNRQYNLPEIGKQIADNANREGVAERCDDPAVHQTLAIALALLTYYDQRRSDLALFLLKTAKPPDAQTLSLLQTVPGLGKILRLVLLDDMHQLDRCPRGQDFASYCRRIPCAKASGGTRLGTAGTTIGHAPLPWAFSDAAPLFRRGHEPGQTSLATLEKKHDKGTARSSLAHQLARAVSGMRQRKTAVALEPFLRPEGSSAGAPGAARDTAGSSRHRTAGKPSMAASLHAEVRRGPRIPAPRALLGHSLGRLERRRWTASGVWVLPLPRA